MEQIEFKINGQLYEVEETEGKYSVVQDSVFIGQMYKEKGDEWSWETAEANSLREYPWKEIGNKIHKHLVNLT